MSNQPERIKELIRDSVKEANTFGQNDELEEVITQIAFEFYKKGFKEAIKSVKTSADGIENYFINGVDKK